MVKRSKLLQALDAHKGRDYDAEKQKKQVKAAEKRKGVKKTDTSPAKAKEPKQDKKEEAVSSEAEESEEEEEVEEESAEDNAEDDEEEDEEEEEDIPLSDLEDDEREDIVTHQRLTINNSAAINNSLKRISFITSATPFSEHNSLVSKEPITVEDPHDDLNRELSFYKVCQAAAAEARGLLKKEGIPFTRPGDYFAEMVKNDEHMDKIKKKLYDEAAGKKAAAEARRQRDLKKFGKQVQVAKLQQRAKEKRETLEKINDLKKKRKADSAAPTDDANDLFDVAIDDAGQTESRKRGRGENGPHSKRQKKDQKFGFGGKKRHAKSGDAASSGDMRSFSAKKMKSGSKRPGKSKRAQGRINFAIYRLIIFIPEVFQSSLFPPIAIPMPFPPGFRLFRKTMSGEKILEGCFAIHKPQGVTSADVLRTCQKHFNPSKTFAPWLEDETARRKRENSFQKRRRRDKRVEVKIGHGGTLDPLATGVLIAGVGKGTKSLQDFLGCTKSYETVVLFGAETDSYDRLGKIVRRAPCEHVTREKVEEALKQFRGKIMQRPPIFSALRIDGKRLYEYAREGKMPPVEIKSRPVEAVELEIMEWLEPGEHEFKFPEVEMEGDEKVVAERLLDKENAETAETAVEGTESSKRKPSPEADSNQDASKKQKVGESGEAQPAAASESEPAAPESASEAAPVAETTPVQPRSPAVKIKMTVTSGFYVRSLAHDLGKAVGTCAFMSELVRSRQGEFELHPDKVLEYKDLDAGEEVWGPKVTQFLSEWEEKRATKAKAESEAPKE
ncbi:hypothetical protein N7478_004840 [Penicillium angulare]|uniref:uncharacterized protein n=1 Tax=Penicillium angulare TaxID=116970 RepID=UPI00254257E8|nr:uncharacterized protein N7478_004840 [Penicillium angulare]KAJ5279468.1 hypothetical protein N7478_004840 [Penicillium angulare]